MFAPRVRAGLALPSQVCVREAPPPVDLWLHVDRHVLEWGVGVVRGSPYVEGGHGRGRGHGGRGVGGDRARQGHRPCHREKVVALMDVSEKKKMMMRARTSET